MTSIERASCLWLVIGIVAAGSIAQAQPTTPKENIPSGVADDVKQQIEQLYSPSPKERVAAIRKLGNMRGKAAAAIPFLMELFTDREWTSNPSGAGRTTPGSEAMEAVAQIGEKALEPLIAALTNEQCEIRVRTYAALSLGHIKHPRATRALLAALKDCNRAIRVRASSALTFSPDPLAAEALVGALKDRDPFVRKNAMAALAKTRDPRAVEPLIGALGDGVLRQTAAAALGEMGELRARKPLMAAMRSDLDCDFRLTAEGALQRIIEAHTDECFAKVHTVDLARSESTGGGARLLKIAVNEGDGICFRLKGDKDPHPWKHARIEPRSNSADEKSRLIDFVFLKPIGPTMLSASSKGRVRTFEAVKAGVESVDVFYGGGAPGEPPSVTVEVTITPLRGEAAEAKAQGLEAERQLIAALGEVEADDMGFLINLHRLRIVSKRDPSPLRRRAARDTLKAIGGKMVAWLNANPGVYNADVLLGCGQARVGEALPIYRRYLEKGDNVDANILRCCMTSLAQMEGKQAIKSIAPYLRSKQRLLRTTAYSTLREITKNDYAKESARYRDWREWWNKGGGRLYGAGEYRIEQR